MEIGIHRKKSENAHRAFIELYRLVLYESHKFSFNERKLFMGPKGYSAKSLQSCPTLCDPIDGSSPGSPVPGILQARTLEWVAISFSNAGK